MTKQFVIFDAVVLFCYTPFRSTIKNNDNKVIIKDCGAAGLIQACNKYSHKYTHTRRDKALTTPNKLTSLPLRSVLTNPGHGSYPSDPNPMSPLKFPTQAPLYATGCWTSFATCYNIFFKVPHFVPWVSLQYSRSATTSPDFLHLIPDGVHVVVCKPGARRGGGGDAVVLSRRAMMTCDVAHRRLMVMHSALW